MRTRTLLLLAVACGTAILVAGVAQFVRLAGQDEPARPVAMGTAVTVGDLEVVVDDVTDDGRQVRVDVELGGVDDAGAAGDFRLVVPGQSIAPRPPAGTAACGPATVAPQRCTLTFVLPEEPGTTRVLVLHRGDDQVRWDLAAG